MLNDNFNNIRVIFVQFKTETSVIAGASKLTNTEQDELKKKVLSKYHDLLENAKRSKTGSKKELAKGFIRPSSSLAGVPVLFV
ncbi:hypothetical protein FRB96_009533 [Tulasnella sp. 330]|nr:hypothetical protein FRB96_009533 [Tulasnella sp. 330]